jgi:hypothetical protein
MAPMAYDFNVRDDGTSPCTQCGTGNVKHMIVERIDDVAFVPLWRSVRRHKICDGCRFWWNSAVDPITRDNHPRTRGVLGRIIISYALFAMLLGVGLALWADYAAVKRSYAAAPHVGDRWTIATRSWTGVAFENGGKYGVVKVLGVTDDSVAVAACNVTYDDSGDARDHCKTFRLAMAPVARKAVPKLYADHAIARITREDVSFIEVHRNWILLMILVLGLLVGHGVLTKRRYG